ncbi:hypothetical protein BDB00DRAFT_745474, partial [Zychaea mexicana]|uniref:uncharacterized protein n=1 Tax=Zychaea mexicana TaxID=64656 RepID=UPI0022FE2EF1
QVYLFIDTIFDNIYSLDVRIGEMESTASSERRNLTREPNERKRHGHRSDMLFKCFQGGIGCTEVGKKDVGDSGTKEQKELGLKVPKMLKDQMWKLVHVYPDHRCTLVTARLVMMGLKLRTIVLDNLSTYIYCIYKTEPCYFPATIETFARDFGMLLGITSQIKQ